MAHVGTEDKFFPCKVIPLPSYPLLQTAVTPVALLHDTACRYRQHCYSMSGLWKWLCSVLPSAVQRADIPPALSVPILAASRFMQQDLLKAGGGQSPVYALVEGGMADEASWE